MPSLTPLFFMNSSTRRVMVTNPRRTGISKVKH